MESCCKKIENAEKRQPKPSWLAQLCLLPIAFYRYFISPFLGPKCRFYPSCSHYAEEAIRTHGAIYGCALALRRLLKCHPWHSGGLDPVPEKRQH